MRRIQRAGLPEPVAVHLVLTPGWSDFGMPKTAPI